MSILSAKKIGDNGPANRPRPPIPTSPIRPDMTGTEPEPQPTEEYSGPLVSIRFASGLSIYYAASEIEETQMSFKVHRKDGDKMQLVAVVNKQSGFALDTEFPVAVNVEATKHEIDSEFFKVLPWGPIQDDASLSKQSPSSPESKIKQSGYRLLWLACGAFFVLLAVLFGMAIALLKK